MKTKQWTKRTKNGNTLENSMINNKIIKRFEHLYSLKMNLIEIIELNINDKVF